MEHSRELRIGLVLGSGSSRGLSHIGIISELLEQGVTPHVVCGTSVGAMVGAAWVTGRLDKLREWALGMTRFRAARFLNINARFTGFLDIDRFDAFLNEFVADDDTLIEDAPTTFGAVATEMATARERWLTEGSLKEAVWASMALPGLFPPRRW
ncbi:MAG TPA: patatin-like phospholipase family protein, partial [Pseudomonadales bacterium]|nr:patatin-like phospholipase family protein [Pseudomonadales bacterium]